MTGNDQRGLHHAAYACRDLEETRHFYEDLMGFPLVHVETQPVPDGGHFRHLFFDLGDGSSMAFFHVKGMGEKPDADTAVSTAAGYPVWVNHIAFTATAEQQEAARERMAAAGIEPLMESDHGWCQSLYYVDPNGIMVEFCRDSPGFTPDTDGARRHLAELAAADAAADAIAR